MRLRAMAKINLGLDVTGKRPDGYHNVRMIMQTVRMYDQIEMEIEENPGVRLETNLPFLPTDDRNLAVRAAGLLLKEFPVENGVCIRLSKTIPVAAGLAGGSADAAAVLVGVNQMFHLGLSREELMKRAAELGADVPYCVLRGTALAEGIGEKLTPLPEIPPCYVLLAKPGISVSTKLVYSRLDQSRIGTHPDIDGMLEAIKAGSLEGITGRMQNVLETVTEPEFPMIGELKKMMREHGAMGAMMSGSGPTVFGIYREQEKARESAAVIRKSGLAKRIFLTQPFHRTRSRKGF